MGQHSDRVGVSQHGTWWGWAPPAMQTFLSAASTRSISVMVVAPSASMNSTTSPRAISTPCFTACPCSQPASRLVGGQRAICCACSKAWVAVRAVG
jgi:GTP cyclohydrolase FolE2